jgi:hypothetical protein
MPFSNAFSTFGSDQPFKDAVGRLALEITESGVPMADQFGRPVTQADVTFNFTSAVIARYDGGRAAGMTLHMTKDIGLDPVWDFVTYGIP